MGRFERLQSKAISLRGAVAFAGAAVIAASMAQASGTLAASEVTRTAKMEVVSQNYFPTPLPVANMGCSESAWFKANFSWNAPGLPGNYRYKVTVWNGDSVKDGPWLQSERSREITWNYSGRGTYQIAVQVVNYDGNVENATSSGELRRALWHDGLNSVDCTGEPWRVENESWENQREWIPGNSSFAPLAVPSVFTAMFDEFAADGMLGELPEGDELTTLDEVAPDAAPTTSVVEAALPSSPRPSPSTSARESAPSSTTRTSSAQETSEAATSKSTASQTTHSSSPTVTSLLPEPSPSTPATTTTPPTVKAGVWDYPIPVGEASARLEDVDGRTHLVVSRGGTKVCSAEVDGASRIEEANGELTVTVAGRTSKVDIGTCELT